MSQQEIIPPQDRGPSRRSLPQAYIHFLRDPRENRVLKLMPLVLMGIIPISVVDDFLLPIIGIADDIPTSLLVVIVAGLTYIRVRAHR